MQQRPAFEQHVSAAWTPEIWRDVTVLVAVSGGQDSIALLRALAAIRQPGQGRLVVGHFNHQWRAAESLADEDFVRGLCHDLSLPCEVGQADRPPRQADRPPRQTAVGSEASARADRYLFFRQLADRLGARYLAMGHTADDQAETILYRVMRGTGLTGLAGIPATRKLSELTIVIRPLLAMRRSMICDYLAHLNQPFRHDSSNDSTHFTRNRIRHDLLPQLAQQYNSQVRQALLRLGHIAGEAQAVIAQVATSLAEEAICYRTADQVSVTCERLEAAPELLVREALIAIWKQQDWPLQQMGADQWQQLADFVCRPDGDSTGPMLPGGIRVTRVGSTLELCDHSAISPD